MRLKKIIRMFEKGSVCVVGLRGRGKDMLTANVVVRRGKKYIGNTCYDESLYIPFNYKDIDCGGNTYKNFITGDIKYYEFPYERGTDVYLSDCGVYFPAQYCNQLNNSYGQLSVYQALCRQAAGANFHTNCQNLNRIYDKIREHSDLYIYCCRCFYWKGWVLQQVRIYDRYQSCVDRVPPYAISRPMLNRDRIQRWEMDKQHYDILYGRIQSGWLLYRNRSTYDTNVFKEMMKNGKKEKNT